MFRSYRRLLLAFTVVGVLLVAFVGGDVNAAATGKITGTITDSETKEPIIGASVLVVGTQRGAQTDLDGKFQIVQIEPGVHTLRVTAVGFQPVEVKDVAVKADITTDQTFVMTKTATELKDAIVITGTRDKLEIREVSNQMTITKEEIEHQPVTTVDELLTQVAGVVTNTQGEVFIRGGRAGEVSYIVDGVPLDDPLGGLGQAGAQMSLVSGSIQEFTVIKDGFDPEYGDALSGIVKITTQTGSQDNTRVNMQYITDDFGNEDLNKYSRNNDYLRFSLSGPDPFLKNKILPALGLRILEDQEFTYYLYAELDKNDGIYQYEDYDTPLSERNSGFFNLFGIHVPERLRNRYYWMANLKFRPQQNLRFILSYKESKMRNSVFDWQHRFSANTAPIYEDNWRSISLEVSQSLSKDMTYEAVFSYYESSKSQKPGDPNNPGKGLNPDQFGYEYEWETYEDRNQNGQYDAPEPIVNLFPDTTNYGTDFTGPRYTYSEDSLFVTDVQNGTTWGTNFRFNENYQIDNFEGEPYIDLNGNGVWDRGDYLQDKNGNGVLDAYRVSNVGSRRPEPYVDGDSIVGEPFTDVNKNGIYDLGIDGFVMNPDPALNQDYNHNGSHDGPDDEFTPGTPFVDRNGNGVYDSPNFRFDAGEPFNDLNGNGKWDAGGTQNFLNPLSHSEDVFWHYQENNTIRGDVKVFRQWGNHELKAGVGLRRLDFIMQRIDRPYVFYTGRNDGGPYPTRGAFRDMFAYQPWAGTVYLRDKLEYGSMIASLGLRWDFFLQDTESLIPVAQADDLGGGVILGDRQKFSPRIGFSYPISDKAKVHFNYGHFYQLPDLSDMYARNTTAIDQNSVIGNYNLDYMKTVQYSFGVKYAMSEYYNIDVSGYFKDEFDKINSALVLINGLNRQQFRNRDYGRSRGFEVELEKRGGGYVNGMISYTYGFAYGKASEASRVYQSSFELSREPLDEAPLDHDIRHSLKSNIQVFVPNTVKPRLFGLPIPNGWALSLETIIESGRPFTPDRSYPNISTVSGEDIQRNSLRMPSNVLFDVRFTKDFEFAGLDLSYILWVENIFDARNVVEVYNNTGRPDTRQNQSQIIRGGTEYDKDPYNWDYGRQIRMGVEVNL